MGKRPPYLDMAWSEYLNKEKKSFKISRENKQQAVLQRNWSQFSEPAKYRGVTKVPKGIYFGPRILCLPIFSGRREGRIKIYADIVSEILPPIFHMEKAF